MILLVSHARQNKKMRGIEAMQGNNLSYFLRMNYDTYAVKDGDGERLVFSILTLHRGSEFSKICELVLGAKSILHFKNILLSSVDSILL